MVVYYYVVYQNQPLTIWPGYLNTIRHHEDGYLLVVEIIHKVLRRDTAFDVLNKIRQAGGDVQVRLTSSFYVQLVVVY